MRKNTGLAPLVLVIIAAVLLGGGYLFARKAGYFPETAPSDIIQPMKDSTADWKTYSYKDYSFKYPPSWRLEKKDTGAIFSIGSAVVAALRCPIREIGYEAWNIESETRKISSHRTMYPVTLWNLTDKDRQSNPLGDFSLILINQDNFEDSCEISLSYRLPDSQEIARMIYLSVSILDETAGWKTYRNEKYGFEFKYPSAKWYAHERNTFVILLKTKDFPDIASEGYAYGQQIIVGVRRMVGAYDKELTQEQYIQALSADNEYTGKPTKITEVKVGGINMLRVEHRNENMQPTLSYYYFKSGKVFHFYLYPFETTDTALAKNYEDFQEVLFSFKFTN